jgi:Xaa-Pro aminopeptidase
MNCVGGLQVARAEARGSGRLIMANWAGVQEYMRSQKIDGWLVYDFRGNNSVFAQVLPGKRWTTRRAALFIPATGEPSLIMHGIDEHQFKKLDVKQARYLSWQDFRSTLTDKLQGASRVAMEYAAGGALPVVSIVDAGTVEMIRSLGVDVVSSANLIQVHVARWSESAQKLHREACDLVGKIKDEAFSLIRDKLSANKVVHEHEVQQFIMSRFTDSKLETSEPPIVGVNAHSGDPHFEPSADKPTPIKKGDWILIDLWARRPGEENIFCDITWVGYAGSSVPEKHQKVFNTVKAARDAAVQRAKQGWSKKEALQGWQLDEAARAEIINAGYAEFIRHRTGHSLSPGPMVHGLGVNIDNLETHDTREILPGIGYTVEPGIYTPEFGVRLEINVFTDPTKGPIVTSCIQDEVVRVG